MVRGQTILPDEEQCVMSDKNGKITTQTRQCMSKHSAGM